MIDTLGSGISGLGPVPAETGSRAAWPHAVMRSADCQRTTRRRRGWVRMSVHRREDAHTAPPTQTPPSLIAFPRSTAPQTGSDPVGSDPVGSDPVGSDLPGSDLPGSDLLGSDPSSPSVGGEVRPQRQEPALGACDVRARAAV